jgi:hypothetical protein
MYFFRSDQGLSDEAHRDVGRDAAGDSSTAGACSSRQCTAVNSTFSPVAVEGRRSTRIKTRKDPQRAEPPPSTQKGKPV